MALRNKYRLGDFIFHILLKPNFVFFVFFSGINIPSAEPIFKSKVPKFLRI
jgi:hypothetical protein